MKIDLWGFRKDEEGQISRRAEEIGQVREIHGKLELFPSSESLAVWYCALENDIDGLIGVPDNKLKLSVGLRRHGENQITMIFNERMHKPARIFLLTQRSVSSIIPFIGSTAA